MLSINKTLPALVLAAVLLAGCGSSTSSAPSAAKPTPPGATTGAASPGSGPAALSAEPASAATGDIPDNQVFLVFTNRSAGYSIKYPDGWTQAGAGTDVTFRNKNNLVHVVIVKGRAPTPASVASQLNSLRSSNPTVSFQAPQLVHLGSSTAVKAIYSTESAPNAVTGKRVKLVVDRYELTHGGKVATVDLGTPVGVDNKDAYRMMIQSLHWL
jgi:hypothetical protein